MKKLLCMLLTLLLLLGLTACGAASKGSADYAVEETWAAAEAPGEMANGLTSQTQSGSQSLPENRKWIITVNMSAETEDLDTLLSSMDEQIAQLQGFVEEQRINSRNRYRSASLTVRIPAESVDAFTTHMAASSNVVSSSKNLEDITLTYVSTESRMQALQTEEARLLELMGKAETMADLLEIEARLTDVRWELESVTSQLRTMDNQVNYATVYLNITEVTEYTPVEEKTVWQRISGGFVDSLKGLGSGILELLIWILVNSPYLIVIAAIGLLIFFAIRRRRRRKQIKSWPNPQKPEKTEE